MPLRFAITKSTAQGETMVVDCCQWNPVTGEVLHTVDEMNEMADEALKLSDMRLLEMNTRILEAESLEAYCTPLEWSKILSVIDVMCGRMTADTLRRRWQSVIEENAELEAGRQAAAKENEEERAFYQTIAEAGECTCSRFTADIPCPQHERVSQ